MKYILIICFLVASMVYAGSQPENLMPVGFDQVRIGMDWRSLVALRPNAEIMNMMPNPGEDLKPDPENPKGGLVEKLTTGFFDRALYFFEDGILVGSGFAKEKGSASSDEREDIIRNVARQRGMPTLFELEGKQREQGVLTWQDQALHIKLLVPTDETKLREGLIALQIMNLKYAERIKAIGVSDDAEKDKYLQGADKQRLETLKSEIKTLLSVKDSNP